MNGLCDLHTHSRFSDGSSTPEQIIEIATALHLSAVALCDHNTVDGLPDFLQAAEGKDIEAIPGAEFSVDYNGTELHLLGLYIPTQYFSQISGLMREVNARKEQSNIALTEALNKAGYSVDYAHIKSLSPNGNVNRAHIAEYLTQAGYTPTIDRAFDTLLNPETGYYKEPERLSVWEMIDTIRSVNAAPILAHPFLNLSEKELIDFAPQAKKRGLAGLECAYSTYSNSTAAKALELAEALEMLPSGGSDYHGDRKPDIYLGSGKGNLKVPYEWAQRIKNTVV